MVSEKPKEKILTYQALRGIAALFILFSHMHYLSASDNPFWHCLWNGFMSNCGIFTSFFFLCSGFFLQYTWKKDVSFGKYIKGKLKRIYPITLIVFLLALAVELLLSGQGGEAGDAAVGSSVWYFNIAANLLLFKAFVPFESVFYSFHGPSWYISALFGFYLIAYPFLRGMHSQKRDKWKKVIIAVCISAYAVEFAVCIIAQLHSYSYLWPCYVNPWFRIFGECFAGVLICEYMPLIQKRLSRIPAAPLEIFGVILLIAAVLLRNVIHLYIYPAWIQLFFMGSLLLIFRSEKGICSAVLKKKPLQFLGTVSFELYMTHAFVYEGLPVACGFVSKTVRRFLLDNPGTRFVITLVLCIIFAWIVHLLMEQLNKKVVSKL